MPKTYTVKQVADALNLSTNTVYKYLEDGSIKATRLGGTGRFKIPETELARLLGQTSTQPPIFPTPIAPISSPPEIQISTPTPSANPTFFSSPHHLHLFDWFLSVTSILLGLVYLIYPLQNLTGNFGSLVVLDVVKIGLILAGIFVVGVDLISPHRHHLGYHLRTLPLSLVYAILCYGFIITQFYFNFVITLVLFLFSIFPSNFAHSFFRFILFSTAIIAFPIFSVILIHQSPLLSPIIAQFISNYPIPVSLLVIFITGSFLAISLFLLTKKSPWVFAPLALNGTILLFLSAVFLSRIHWTPAIVFMTTGAFSFLFPFSTRIDKQLPFTRKQYLITFAWFLTIVIIGTFVISLNQISFETLVLKSQSEKINSAIQNTNTFIENSTKYLTGFSQDVRLQSTTPSNIDDIVKSFYLNSTTFRSLAMVSPTGQILSQYPPSSLPKNLSGSQYFRETDTSGSPVIFSISDRLSNDNPISVFIAVPIYNDTHFLGQIIGNIDSNSLNSQLNNISSLEGGNFIMADQNGAIFISNNRSLLGSSVNDSQYLHAAITGSSGKMISNSLTDDSLSFIAYSPVSKIGWSIALETPYDTTATKNTYTSFAILLFTLFLGSGTLTATWYLKNNS